MMKANARIAASPAADGEGSGAVGCGGEVRSQPAGDWQAVCQLDDILPDTGVCALVGGRQIAVFRLVDGSLYALDNRDPNSGANVMSRGIVGDLEGEPVVASPLYKHHYALRTGRCLENPDTPLGTHAVTLHDGVVYLPA